MRPSVTRLLAVALLSVATVPGCRDGGSGPPAPPPAGTGAGMGAEWRWEAPPRASVGMPATDGPGVAFTYGHRYLALYGADGTPRWEQERVGLRDVAPRLTPDLVVAATDDGVVAFDRATGLERWHTVLGERANTPVMAGGRAVVSTWEGSLVALEAAAGRVAWRATLPGPAVGPAAEGGGLVVTTWESEHGDAAGAVAVDAATGRRRWAVPLEPGGVSAPAVTSGGTVVVVAGDVAAHGLQMSTGQPRWRVETGGAGSPEAPPLVADGGAVLVASRLGEMALVDEGDGRVRWRASADAAVVRGGPAGPGPRGRYALPLDDGRLLVAGPDRGEEVLDPPGRVSGVAVAGGGLLLVATRGAAVNALVALHGW